MKRILSAAVLLLAACSDPSGSDGRVRVRPEREAYAVFRPDEVVDVQYTLTNTKSVAIQIPTCGAHLAVDIDSRQNGAWVFAGPAWYCLAMLTPPQEVAPGATITDEVQVTGFGTWRVRVPYGWQGDPADDAHIAVSTAFMTGTLEN